MSQVSDQFPPSILPHDHQVFPHDEVLFKYPIFTVPACSVPLERFLGSYWLKFRFLQNLLGISKIVNFLYWGYLKVLFQRLQYCLGSHWLGIYPKTLLGIQKLNIFTNQRYLKLQPPIKLGQVHQLLSQIKLSQPSQLMSQLSIKLSQASQLLSQLSVKLSQASQLLSQASQLLSQLSVKWSQPSQLFFKHSQLILTPVKYSQCLLTLSQAN